MFYGGDTKFSYIACQWIEAQAIETGEQIHHKIYGHCGERVLNDNGKKTPVLFMVDGYELKLTQCISFIDVIGMGIHS